MHPDGIENFTGNHASVVLAPFSKRQRQMSRRSDTVSNHRARRGRKRRSRRMADSVSIPRAHPRPAHELIAVVLASRIVLGLAGTLAAGGVILMLTFPIRF
jgi:hypothetical protein